MARQKEGRLTAAEQEVVKMLTDTQAVNFEAIGTAFAKVGPSATVMFEGEDIFCGTMRRFLRVFRLRDELAGLETLGNLREVGKEISG